MTMTNSPSQSRSRQHASYFPFKLNGKQAPTSLITSLVECTIENSLNLANMCVLRFEDTDFDMVNKDLFPIGASIEVSGEYEKSPNPELLFMGEITGLEYDITARGVPTLQVRCYDKSHRLHRGRKTQTFTQVKDSDLVKQVASKAGMKVTMKPTTEVYEWVIQANQTDWEFLSERAERIGYRLFVRNHDELHFCPVESGPSSGAPREPMELVWGEDILSFRPSLAASPQVDEVVVRGWDPKKKKPIVGTAKKANGLPSVAGKTADGAAAAKKGYQDAAKMVVVDRPVHTQREADNLAQSLLDEIAGEYLEAEALCEGLLKLVPGMMVKLTGVGKRFSGQYHVTAVTHIYNPSENLVTQFSVSGKSSSTLVSQLDGDGGTRNGHGFPSSNVVVALVTDLNDPDNLGRVKVSYPWLGDRVSSHWVRQAAPMAGPSRGFYFLPEVNDEVLIAFEHGELTRPYIIGVLWNGADKPVEENSKAVKDGKVVRRTLKTRIGHTILLDDTDNKGEINLTTKGKHVLTLNDRDQNITAKSTSGHTVVLDDKNKNITAKTQSGNTILMDDRGRKIQVTDPNGNMITISTSSNAIDVKCLGNFTVDATGQIILQGKAGIKVSTPAAVQIDGSLVTAKASTGVQIQAGATMQIMSGAVMTIQGTLVKIN